MQAVLGSLAFLVVLLGAVGANARTYFVWNEVNLQFSNLGRVEASATASGIATLHTSSTTSSHLQTITLAASPLASLMQAVPVTDPSAAPVTKAIFSVRHRPDLQGDGVIGGISGAIASTAGGVLPNTLPMTGGVTLCLLAGIGPCTSQLALPVGATSGGFQVGGGVGGILTIGGSGTVRVSVVGAPYTVKTVSAANRTANGGFELIIGRGFAHGPSSFTSSTAATSGVIQLVTASHITSESPDLGDLSGTISRVLMHVIHIPEPRMALLLTAGAAVLALLGQRKRSQQKRAQRRVPPQTGS